MVQTQLLAANFSGYKSKAADLSGYKSKMEDLKVIFAQNLIMLRKQMRLTQIELAEKINYSDKAVSKWERGESIPDVSVLLELAKLFGVSIDFLVTEHENKEIAKEQTSYAATVKKRNHILIAAITFVAILIAETIVFIALQGAMPNFWRNVMFCYALPLPLVSVVAIVFTGLWANRILSFAAVSALIWTVLADAFFIILLCGTIFPHVFILGIPAEIVAMMSYKIKLPGRSKPEQK